MKRRWNIIYPPFHSNRVIYLFSKSQYIFPHLRTLLSYFILSSSLYLFHSLLTIPLLNSPKTIFVNIRVEKKRLHYYGMEGVWNMYMCEGEGEEMKALKEMEGKCSWRIRCKHSTTSSFIIMRLCHLRLYLPTPYLSHCICICILLCPPSI